MLYENLTQAQKRIYNQAITETHQRRIHMHVQTLDGNPVASLSPVFVSGQVAIDTTSNVSTRILTCQFLDPTRSLNFEPDAGGENLHRKYQVQINDSRLIAPLEMWVDCYVHTGPIWEFDRQGMVVSLTAHGADRKAKGTVRQPRWWHRKTKKTTIIRELLQAAGAGPADLRIPDLKATTGHRVVIGFRFRHHQKHHKATKGHKAHDTTVTNRVPRTDHYWEKAHHVAGSMNRWLYANGSGVFVLRPFPERPVLHVFRHLLADVQIQRPGADTPNVWTVIGAKPKGTKRKVRATVELPPAHPLSPSSLAWNGKRFENEHITKNPHLKRIGECRAVGRRHRDRAARVVVDYELDMLPVPWLNEHDIIGVPTNGGLVQIILTQWTLPLSPNAEAMHVGAVKRTAIPSEDGVAGVAGIG